MASERAMSCVLGGLVADAAGCPLHWLYDQEKMAAVLKKKPDPEFFSPCQSPFFTVETGSHSCAGDQAFILMQSLIECKGFNKEDYKSRIFQHFGPGSSYDVLPGKAITKADYPIPGPWKSGVIKEFLKNYEEGKERTGHKGDPNGDAYAKMIVVAGLYAGNASLPSIVEEVTRVLHDDDVSVNYAMAVARLLEHMIIHDNTNFEEALKSLPRNLEGTVNEVMAEKQKDHKEAVRSMGIACALPGSFKSALHGLIQPSSDYKEAVRRVISAGGDLCPRAMFVGGIKGCEAKIIPADWVKQCKHGQDIAALASKLVALRNSI